jgi:hypothetical protein
MDTEDKVIELFLELAQKLMREYAVPPQLIARISLGAAVHLFMEHHEDGARVAAAYLREKADELDALCAPKPASVLN